MIDDLNIPWFLVGIGAGLASEQYVTTTLLAGTSVLVIAAVPFVVGWLLHHADA